jgi:hypothetical protein
MEPNTANAAGARERRAALCREKRWLVETGDTIGKLAGASEDWASQGRVLWEAARNETEPSVLPNLLRYQYARNRKTWPEPVFQGLSDAIKTCIDRAKEDDALALELIRHLLVYTLRAYTFHAKGAKS